ncbi:MAG: hypothetical protein E7I45_10610 [Eikenella corrodens]|uniref:hypothetical protein n=1 Tax=Eikenella corrodens TaxID=539 RepID=UPI002906BB41|nr:hypothetical protein [Eikenella corrodens]MDU4301401.1 hypothetical protein [Eikenella corrodens]
MKKTNWITCGVISLWLVAAHFNQTARESVHYFLWVLNVAALLVLLFSKKFQQETKAKGFRPGVLFDAAFTIASIFYGWPALAAVQAFNTLIALSLMFNKETSK